MYSRKLDGVVLEFGVSGKLWQNALLMYDRRTSSLWSQVTGEAVRGEMKGKKLQWVTGMPRVTWGEWSKQHLDTKILTDGRGREDQGSQYESYFSSGRVGIFDGPVRQDGRLRNKEKVVGVQIGERAKAYPYSLFSDGRMLVTDALGGTPILVFHDSGSRASAAYLATDGKSALTFSEGAQNGVAVDDQTGTVWNLFTGEAERGLLAGKRLEPVRFMELYWFAWADFHPETEVYKPQEEKR